MELLSSLDHSRTWLLPPWSLNQPKLLRWHLRLRHPSRKEGGKVDVFQAASYLFNFLSLPLPCLSPGSVECWPAAVYPLSPACVRHPGSPGADPDACNQCAAGTNSTGRAATHSTLLLLQLPIPVLGQDSCILVVFFLPSPSCSFHQHNRSQGAQQEPPLAVREGCMLMSVRVSEWLCKAPAASELAAG